MRTRKKNQKKLRHTASQRKSEESTPKVWSSVMTLSGSSDRILFVTVMSLILFGLFMIASAGVLFAEDRFDDPYYFFKRQLVGVSLGLVALFILDRFDYHFFRKWSLFIFIGAICLLCAVLLSSAGVSAYGAQRWISVGNFSFQPAEAVKLAIILYVSAWCSSKGARKLQDFVEGAIPFVIMVGIVSFLILLQPDVGTLGVVILVASCIFFLAGAQIKHLAFMFVAGLLALVMLIKAEPYRMERFLTFLNPEADTLGAGYHIAQAAIAIGSGGILGLGLGHSKQKGLFLPEPVGDSIFAIIAEEFGFLGCALVIAAFITVTWRIFIIASEAPDLFGRLTATGIGVWIVGQAFMNMAAISGLMPLTGIPLTFISFGGTSMVFSLAAIGIVLNISRQSRSA